MHQLKFLLLLFYFMRFELFLSKFFAPVRHWTFEFSSLFGVHFAIACYDGRTGHRIIRIDHAHTACPVLAIMLLLLL